MPYIITIILFNWTLTNNVDSVVLETTVSKERIPLFKAFQTLNQRK